MMDLSELLQKNVRELMSENVIILLDTDPMAQVFRIFDRAQISGAPVINDEGVYVGVLTKTDLLQIRHLEESIRFHTFETTPIRVLMNPCPLLTVNEDDNLETACQRMVEGRVHRVFVVNGQGTIVGVISTYDVARVLVNQNASGNSATPVEKAGHGRNQHSLLKFLMPARHQNP